MPIKEISNDYTIQIWKQNILSYLILKTHYVTWASLRNSKEKGNLMKEISHFNGWVKEIDKEKKTWSVLEQQTVDLQSSYWKNIYKIRAFKQNQKTNRL